MQWFEETKFFPDWSPCFGTIQIKGTKRWVFFDDPAKKLFSKSMVFNLNMAIKPLPLTGTHILNPMAVFTLNDLMKLFVIPIQRNKPPEKAENQLNCLNKSPLSRVFCYLIFVRHLKTRTNSISINCSGNRKIPWPFRLNVSWKT